MTLDQLKHNRRKLQGVEAAAAQAMQREQKQVDEAQFQIRECERDLDAARDRATLDAAEAALHSASKDYTLAVKRLTDRQGEHAYAQMQAGTAQAMVVNAVDQLLNAERETIAAECIEIYQRLTQKIVELRAVVPDELNTPRHLVAELSSTVMQALNLVPPPDATMIPVNVLQFGAVGNTDAWAARRARMIADEATEEATAA
jgi:hypothetical protein